MKYKGIFNYHGQNIALWTHAKDEHQAFCNFVTQLVEIVGVIRIKLYNYFKGPDKDNYLIEKKEKK